MNGEELYAVFTALVVGAASASLVRDWWEDRRRETAREARKAARRLEALRSGRLWVVDDTSSHGPMRGRS